MSSYTSTSRTPSPSPSFSRSTPFTSPSSASSSSSHFHSRPTMTRHDSFSSAHSSSTDEDIDDHLPSIERLAIRSPHARPLSIDASDMQLQTQKARDPTLRRPSTTKHTSPRLVVVSPAMAHHIALGGKVNIRGPNGQIVGRIRGSPAPYARKPITV